MHLEQRRWCPEKGGEGAGGTTRRHAGLRPRPMRERRRGAYIPRCASSSAAPRCGLSCAALSLRNRRRRREGRWNGKRVDCRSLSFFPADGLPGSPLSLPHLLLTPPYPSVPGDGGAPGTETRLRGVSGTTPPVMVARTRCASAMRVSPSSAASVISHTCDDGAEEEVAEGHRRPPAMGPRAAALRDSKAEGAGRGIAGRRDGGSREIWVRG